MNHAENDVRAVAPRKKDVRHEICAHSRGSQLQRMSAGITVKTGNRETSGKQARFERETARRKHLSTLRVGDYPGKHACN